MASIWSYHFSSSSTSQPTGGIGCITLAMDGQDADSNVSPRQRLRNVKPEECTDQCCCHQLASILLPYLEEFDERAISNLAAQLKGYGITVDAVTASERSPGFRLVFAKESSAINPLDQATAMDTLGLWAANSEPIMNMIDFQPPDTPDLAMFLDLHLEKDILTEQNFIHDNFDMLEDVSQCFCQQASPSAVEPIRSVRSL